MNGDCRLYCGDCRDILPGLPDAPDLVLTDPQYQLANGQKATTNGIAAKRGGANVSKGCVIQNRDWGDFAGDDAPYDPSPWLEYPKVILWGAIHYANRLPNATCWLIWDKHEGVASDDNADCETAWTNLKGPARIHRQLWKGICRRGEENISIQGDKLHPFQKPVALMAWCIALAKLPPNSLILDPYMGSCSTGIAALRMGHRFIGIELDPHHYETAADRVQGHLAQPTLL